MKRLYRRMRYGEPLIVVSGLPRSGTSMVMQMLEAAGVPIATDAIRDADEDNPKGYFELERVKDLHQESNPSWLRQYQGKAIKIIAFLLLYLPKTLNYRVIFMERDLEEILKSQRKMLERRGEADPTSDAKMKENYRNHLIRVRWLLKNHAAFSVLFVAYQDVIRNPYEAAQRINRFLGNRWDPLTMARVVDPSLYRNRKDSQDEANTAKENPHA
ncbi:MAG: sulfotransferase domain-containing protein [bacterium]|nr:sulfotransferase domain-containing protein [bacterium]